MTTNTNTRTPARFAAAAVTTKGRYAILDRADNQIVAYVKGRAAARAMAALLTDFDPAPRVADEPATEAKPEAKRTSHADCDHASSKLARAICRRDRAKADA